MTDKNDALSAGETAGSIDQRLRLLEQTVDELRLKVNSLEEQAQRRRRSVSFGG